MRDFGIVAAVVSIAALGLHGGVALAQTLREDFPVANGTVYAMELSGDTLYIGGSFTVVGGQARNRLAAIDIRGGTVLPWNPNADNEVWTLSLSGTTVYAGGFLTNVGGYARSRVAAIDALSGAVTDWAPSVSSIVEAILVRGSTVYLGGYFDAVNGEPRHRLAAVDATSGALKPWNPDLTGTVIALAASGPTVFAGGDFLAALDTSTGLSMPLPNPSSTVEFVGLNGSMLYVAGWFWFVNDVPRARVARVDLSTGSLTSWNPDVTGGDNVLAVAVSDSSVFLGGDFYWIGGQFRYNLGVVDATTGAPGDWDPSPDWPVRALAVRNHTLLVGGEFSNIAGSSHSFLAAFDLTPAGTVGVTPTPVSRFSIAPNPFSATTRIHFDLSETEVVSLRIYDIRGREVATVLDRESRGPGCYSEVFRGHLPTGVYSCRLETNRLVRTVKLLHIE